MKGPYYQLLVRKVIRAFVMFYIILRYFACGGFPFRGRTSQKLLSSEYDGYMGIVEPGKNPVAVFRSGCHTVLPHRAKTIDLTSSIVYHYQLSQHSHRCPFRTLCAGNILQLRVVLGIFDIMHFRMRRNHVAQIIGLFRYLYRFCKKCSENIPLVFIVPNISKEGITQHRGAS